MWRKMAWHPTDRFRSAGAPLTYKDNKLLKPRLEVKNGQPFRQEHQFATPMNATTAISVTICYAALLTVSTEPWQLQNSMG